MTPILTISGAATCIMTIAQITKILCLTLCWGLETTRNLSMDRDIVMKMEQVRDTWARGNMIGRTCGETWRTICQHWLKLDVLLYMNIWSPVLCSEVKRQWRWSQWWRYLRREEPSGAGWRRQTTPVCSEEGSSQSRCCLHFIVSETEHLNQTQTCDSKEAN